MSRKSDHNHDHGEASDAIGTIVGIGVKVVAEVSVQVARKVGCALGEAFVAAGRSALDALSNLWSKRK